MTTRKPPADRKPLVWEHATRIEQGHAVAEVKTAEGDQRRLYSIAVGRARVAGDEVVVDRYLRPIDVEDAKEALTVAKQWIECDIEEREEREGKKR